MRQLIASHGKLPVGRGLVSGVFALALTLMCVLGVAAFHFPEYLTTPELRRKYDVDLIRQLMYWSMVVAGALSLWNIVLGRTRWLSSTTFALVVTALLLGGHRIEVGDFPDGTPYIGLDWFILDLLGSTLIFVFVEKQFLIVTPNFHHWHHSLDKEALDRNHAAHFAFIDDLFGTAARADRMWPRRYGGLGDYVPEGFVWQLAFPFSTVASVPAAVDAKPAMTPQFAPPSASQPREPNRAPGS